MSDLVVAICEDSPASNRKKLIEFLLKNLS